MHCPTPHDLLIKPRQPEFALPSPWLRHWHGGDAFKSHFFDAMSLLFPDGERFFIDAVRAYRDQVTDPQQQAQIRGFIGQEAHHSREHQHYSEALRESGYDLDYLERRLKKRLAFVRKHLPPKVHLAATTAVEHLTAIMADAILQNPEWLEGADPTMARLWRWHALEESEHKAVAFDLYQQLKTEPGNLFYSPYSISLALAMTWAGAKGQTEADMASTLGFTLPQATLHPAFNGLDLALASRGQNAKASDVAPVPPMSACAR